ncbi:sugar phosphate isomerase/epimerase [bacterium]|nr:sugar phosphate isomerase/epimerase [bacterium]
MKLSISNIAWPIEQDEQVAAFLEKNSVRGIEIAPTKIWQEPLKATDNEIKRYRDFWQKFSIEIVAFQAILYGKPSLTVFGDKKSRQNTIDYLKSMIELAQKLGAKVLVFGSPKNRLAGDLPKEEIDDISYDFFSVLGKEAQDNGVFLCIEANPVCYNADFITTADQAISLVKRVNSPGFMLHLDTACMALSNDDACAVIKKGFSYLKHFHISEHMLGQVGEKTEIDHALCASALKSLSYANWVSIEMREQKKPFSLSTLRKAVEYVKSIY